MNLRFRMANKADFEGFYAGCFYGDQDNLTLRAIVEHEWNVFLGNSATLSMLVEDTERAEKDRVLGMAQTVFVTEAYVTHILDPAQPPHANQHASHPLPNGSWPLLDKAAVARANAGEGLNALTTWWVWRETGLSPLERRTVRDGIAHSYPVFYRGYRYKRLLLPAMGDWACQGSVHAGYRLLSDYKLHYQNYPPASPLQEKFYLLGITREEALEAEGSAVSRVFAYTPPRFGFKPREQNLLWRTLLCEEEATIAAAFDRCPDTLKTWWTAIYERVQERMPGLLPDGGNGSRGEEKREVLLAYLREHLEELRPYELPKGGGKSK